MLIRLYSHKTSREFRTVTGGVFHVSGGETREAIPFKGEKAGDRTFKMALVNLDAGEYGFWRKFRDGFPLAGSVTMGKRGENAADSEWKVAVRTSALITPNAALDGFGIRGQYQ